MIIFESGNTSEQKLSVVSSEFSKLRGVTLPISGICQLANLWDVEKLLFGRKSALRVTPKVTDNVERAVNRQPGYHARTRRADIPKESNKLFPETQIFEIFHISKFSNLPKTCFYAQY